MYIRREHHTLSGYSIMHELRKAQLEKNAAHVREQKEAEYSSRHPGLLALVYYRVINTLATRFPNAEKLLPQ